MTDEDKTFNILRRTPFSEMRGLIRARDTRTIESVLKEHGWTAFDYQHELAKRLRLYNEAVDQIRKEK